MKILILGGTVFLGRHLVEAALQRNHIVTLFNRGHHNADLFPAVEKLRGDRHTDLNQLRGRTWDAVIDTSGYLPSAVQKSAELLAGSVGHYTFISSGSVYADFSQKHLNENSPVARITAEQAVEAEQMSRGERETGATYKDFYGALKVLCEQAAERALPNKVLTVRAGLIVGSFDYTDRFGYWTRRVARGGDVLAPGDPARTVRTIDVRDLAEWNLRMLETGQTGIYNATGADNLTMQQFLDQCRATSSSDANFVWASERFLLEQNVQPWSEMPLWLPEEHNGIFNIANDRAINANLKFRALAETIKDTLIWQSENSPGSKFNQTLKPEREQELLRLLSQQNEQN